jgi:hypothetical protein
MSDITIEFIATCPNRHQASQSFTPREVDEGLTRDTLKFNCILCLASWKPSDHEKANLRHLLERIR